MRPGRAIPVGGFRSRLEKANADFLTALGVAYEYEGHPLKYTVPARETRYTFDLLLPNGIIIEIKGLFDTKDRKKHKLIKQQYPNLDIRMVFSNPHNKIGKKSKTTYGMWCDKLEIPYASKFIPEEWAFTRRTKKRIAAIEAALGYLPAILTETR